MKLKLLTLLFVTTLLNAQSLLLFDKSEQELNSTTNMAVTWTTLYQSDFSITESFTETNGVGSANNDTITDGTITYNNVYKYYSNATDGVHRTQVTLGQASGDLCILTANFYIPSSNTNVDGMALSNAVTPTNIITGTYSFSTGYSGSWSTINLIIAFDNALGLRFNNYKSTVSPFIGANSSTDDIMYLYNIKLEKQVLPTGWAGTTPTKTDYILGSANGLKLVEVTGETKITMSDTLDVGYYKLKVTQDWTQGKLWAHNGTTTYNFPQSDGEYIVKIYLPGNKPLVIGCDNNTISTLSSLSIK